MGERRATSSATTKSTKRRPKKEEEEEEKNTKKEKEKENNARVHARSSTPSSHPLALHSSVQLGPDFGPGSKFSPYGPKRQIVTY